MKQLLTIIISTIFLAIAVTGFSQTTESKTALIIVDIQDFYFPGGDAELINPEEASLNAKKLLEYFREKDMTVIHVRHNYV